MTLPKPFTQLPPSQDHDTAGQDDNRGTRRNSKRSTRRVDLLHKCLLGSRQTVSFSGLQRWEDSYLAHGPGLGRSVLGTCTLLRRCTRRRTATLAQSFRTVCSSQTQYDGTHSTQAPTHTVGWISKGCAGPTLLLHAAITGHGNVPLNLLTIHPQHQNHYQPLPPLHSVL